MSPSPLTLPTVTVADGAAWEARLVAAFETERVGVRIMRRCVDIVELLGVAASGQVRVALVSGSLRRLDAEVVDRLRAAEVLPVGIVRRGAERDAERLTAMGIEVVLPDDVEAGTVAAAVAAAMQRTEVAGPAGSERMFGDPTQPMAPATAFAPGEAPPPGAEELPHLRGTVVAVWGPTGAPGRTTVAINLAAEAARLRRTALLVDADVYGGTIAAALGLLDESPGLAAACRHVASGRLDPAGLAALCWQLTPHLRVLTGIPMAMRWPELRPPAMAAVLDQGRALCELTVVDCGFGLESDEELSYDTVAPRRNGATLAVLDAADVVVVVGSADPIGMQRLVRGLAELTESGVETPVQVVLNRVRSGVVPGDVQAELIGALQRFARRTPAAMLPLDQDAVDAALATGRMLNEIRPASPLRHALVGLAADLTGVPAPKVRRGRRR